MLMDSNRNGLCVGDLKIWVDVVTTMLTLMKKKGRSVIPPEISCFAEGDSQVESGH